MEERVDAAAATRDHRDECCQLAQNLVGGSHSEEDDGYCRDGEVD